MVTTRQTDRQTNIQTWVSHYLRNFIGGGNNSYDSIAVMIASQCHCITMRMRTYYVREWTLTNQLWFVHMIDDADDDD